MRRSSSEYVTTTTANITSGLSAFDVIIPAQSGMIIGLNQIIVSNQLGAANAITLYDYVTPITPTMALGGSGTLIIDGWGGGQLELTKGSGLFGVSNIVGDIEVTVYYVLHDKRTPITKAQARTASYQATTTATRTPNRAGNQSEG